ncbi:MAG TPA: enterotoxin [Gemmatimonadaceae bacterium]|nr:enterotoxin [Gemmatimonadaceae bacterium]
MAMTADDPLTQHTVQPPADDALTRRDFLERGAIVGLAVGALSTGLPHLLRAASAGARAPLAAARSRIDGGEISLANSTIEGLWTVTNGTFQAVRVTDRLNGTALSLPPSAFTLQLADGTAIASAEMRVVAGPTTRSLPRNAHAARRVEQLGGRQVIVTLRDQAGRLEATWRGILRDGSHYLRQEVTLRSLGGELPVREIVLVDLQAPGAYVSGSVKGSPVVAGPLYFGFEHPLSQSTVEGDHVHCALARELPLRPGTSFDVSSVIGVTRTGQLRRDFLAYVERERAHPYRTFLHYNSWYDLGYFTSYDEAGALAVINAFGIHLARERHVVLSSFLFDDGWDDHRTLWHFNSGFPNGFTRVRKAARQYGAAPGVWMSPWGGYGKPRQERLAAGRAQGFEENKGGFVLSGPKYYARFRETCFEMIRKYGVNQFKFDGTGNASSVYPGSAFDSDFDAAIHLIGELRAEEPELYVNLTTGTYPSPFWLRYADSIWRGGSDHDFAGVGSDRQQWITYRDGDTHQHVVGRGPLYPLNSLMLHGLIYARYAKKLDTDPGNDFTSEIRDYFGTGTQLQEMYVTPSLLTRENWDALAEAANWSRRNADTLVDTHWVGGDPAKLEVYGWGAWSPRAGILTLRNPSDRPQSFAVDVGHVLELPDGAPQRYTARSPWREFQNRAPLGLRAGQDHVVDLAPFEVITLEMVPVK